MVGSLANLSAFQKAFGLIAIGLLILVLANARFLHKLYLSTSLWSADQATLVERFSDFGRHLPYHTIKRSGDVFVLERAAQQETYQSSYSVEGHLAPNNLDLPLEDYFERWGTTGFMVLRDSKVTDERYFLGHNRETLWMSFSASKMLVGAMTAIAVEDGAIRSLDDQMSKYASQFIGTAWEEVTFRQALDMTSGVRFNEYDLSLSGDLVKFGFAMARGSSLDEYLQSLERTKSEPGTVHIYSSMDAQALGTATIEATGKTLSESFEEKIWSRLGAEQDAFWITDETGREMALSGWNATLPDYARMGLLFLEGRNWKDEQVIPEAWIDQLRNPSEAFLELPKGKESAQKTISWHQVYAPRDGYGDFAAVGTYGQIIYVNHKTQTVIVTHSVNPNIDNEDQTLEEQFFVFRMISEKR